MMNISLSEFKKKSRRKKNGRSTEAELISELEDRMMEITDAEQNKREKKKIEKE